VESVPVSFSSVVTTAEITAATFNGVGAGLHILAAINSTVSYQRWGSRLEIPC
jgi:hypothetical protein